MLKPLICNLKMNHDFKDMIQYKKIIEDYGNKDLVLCPSFCFLPILYSKKYTLASQNVSAFRSGNHTGEISAKALKSVGVSSTLIGHVECHDSFDVKVAKLKQALSSGMKVYFILSDTKEDYDYQYTSMKLLGMIRALLLQISPKDYERITFVYEPSWLIAGNYSLPIKDVENIFYFMKKELEREYQYNFSFFYGGGINFGNIQLFYDNPNIDGLLLGSFANNPQNIVKFLQSRESSTFVDKTIHS